MEILVAEDDKQLANSLKKNFIEHGHHALIANNGEAALDLVNKIVFDVIILDWRMPKITGIEVCEKLRSSGSNTPIIMLTAQTSTDNKICGLNTGADDYITKPFSFQELLARIHAVVRRYQKTTTELTYKNITINLITRKVLCIYKELKLTDKEFDLLRYFILNKGKIISKEELSKKVWELPSLPSTNIIETTVKNLRKKLETVTNQKFIKTIYSEGYVLLDE